MSLRADQRDYKNAFKKHYHAYSNWQGTGSNLSRRLILGRVKIFSHFSLQALA